MIKCMILDLDGTLIDTSALESLRTQGRWQEMALHFHLCSPYSKVLDVLSTARSAGLKVCIITNSPSNYAQRLLKYFDIHVDYIVGYHDVKKCKPDSEGVEKVLSHFELNFNEAVYLGDSQNDYLASTGAKVTYFSVDWSDPKIVPEDNFGIFKLLEFLGSNILNTQSKTYCSKIIQNGNHFYLGYYLHVIKQEVWNFKDGNILSINRWVFKTQQLAVAFPHIDYVVRALGHDEIQIEKTTNKPLDHLSEQLAQSLNAKYCPNCLKKDRILIKSTRCSAKERKDQIYGAYSVNLDAIGSTNNKALTFLVVDDVSTSGATMSDITRALNHAYPQAKIYLFTLVKTLYRLQQEATTVEAQHNSLLFSDLYISKINNKKQIFNSKERLSTLVIKSNLITKKFSANYAKTNHNFVIQNLKSFSIASEPALKPILDAVFILKNMLQRGKPTLASRKLRRAFDCDGEDNVNGSNHYQALISNKSIQWQRLIRGNVKTDNYPAKYFFDVLIPKYFGEYDFIKQLILPEVQIFDMTQVYVDKFNNKQVDFYIAQVGLIIEIDGQQHEQSQDVDEKRDTFTQSLGLKTIRFTTEEISSENDEFLQKISSILEHIYSIDQLEKEGILIPPNGLTLQLYKQAYINGIDTNSANVRLTAAIRFQLLLLELIENGDIRLGEQANILLINRDGIDFYNDAINDLNDYLKELLILMGLEPTVLKIEVTENKNNKPNPINKCITIDFSIFERYDDSFQTEYGTIFVRTHYLDFYRYFSDANGACIENYHLEDYDFFEMACTEPVTYSIDLSPDSRQRAALRFFLSNLFLPSLNDADFREGQVGIIGSALARKGTIGLLPTGSGKSICYQLSAILQPAVSFVVCPIKSLMYDQKADLDSIGITRCNFITSELKPDQKAKVQSDYGRGKYFFVFISPERFQTRQFRAEMTAIGLDRSFAYAVIDEAHCLSEWGHDFRTSYLNLSNAIGRLAPEASYIGLTATASVNVLKDIQTEFGISDENIRTPIDFTRKELSFHVIDDKGCKKSVALSLVKDMESKWNTSCITKAGIIFTPTVNGEKGCFDLAGHLSSSLGVDVHFFSGSAPQKFRLSGDAFDAYKKKVQYDFKTNKYSLLTATKAFGMGVNKGNVAYTIHFGIPGSMEALYQEAGRAGRDKSLFKDAPADCYILMTKEMNTVALDKIWDASAKVTDLKANLAMLDRGSDVNTNLWMMTNNLDTVNDEYKLLTKIYNFLEQNQNTGKIVVTASQFGADKFKFERAIYRLSQLEIVSDWIIEDFFKGKLHIEFCCLNEVQLSRNIENTIRKYESTFSLSDLFISNNDFYKFINNRLEKKLISHTQYIFLVLLVWSYDHFVYNRRQSLKTVYEQCSDLASGNITEAEFKNRLEGYFKFNNSSHLLLLLAENTTDTSLWLSVFFEDSDKDDVKKIISNEQLIILKEQLSRFLESYKDNACLNYISGVLRLTADQFNDADGERRMSRALERLSNRPMQEIEQLLVETIKLKSLFSINSQCQLAKFFYEKYPQQHILELIHSGLEDPYTYGKLLAPLTARLNNITKHYKGIQW